MFKKLVSVLGHQSVLIVNGNGPGIYHGDSDLPDFFESLIVSGSVGASSLVPFVQMAEFNPQESRLKSIESAVGAHFAVELALPSGFTKSSEPFCKLRIRGGDHASVAKGAKVLGREEAEASHVSH